MREDSHIKMVYAWVKHNPHVVMLEALLTRKHIDKFLMMPDHYHMSSRCFLRILVPTPIWKRPSIAPLVKQEKKSRPKNSVLMGPSATLGPKGGSSPAFFMLAWS